MWCEDDAEERAWLDARIIATRAAIVALEGAIVALSTTGVQSYTLDTGQSRQTVTKSDVSSLRLQLNDLENRLSTLKAKRDGASFYARPGF